MTLRCWAVLATSGHIGEPLQTEAPIPREMLKGEQGRHAQGVDIATIFVHGMPDDTYNFLLVDFATSDIATQVNLRYDDVNTSADDG